MRERERERSPTRGEHGHEALDRVRDGEHRALRGLLGGQVDDQLGVHDGHAGGQGVVGLRAEAKNK